MKTWKDLREVLVDIMDGGGEVYFQPPTNVRMTYPCIVFERSDAYTIRADNNPYVITKRYAVTLITKTADNDLYLDKLLNLPMCTFDRQFIVDNLVHAVFNIYY